jgi:cytochrome c553
MNAKKPRIGILLTILSITISSSVFAESLAVQDCNWCHGTSAQGYTPAPRLAGQQREYIRIQLHDFKNHARDNPFSQQYMWGAAEYIDAQRVRDLARYFASLPGRPANDGIKDFASLGRTIYYDGVPEANIAACVACHGPSAEGVGTIPRLGGLSYTYLKDRLAQWGYGYHANAMPPMPRIARRLSANQIEQLASYLSFVK